MLEYRAELVGAVRAAEVKDAEDKVKTLNNYYADYSELSALQEKLAGMKSTNVVLTADNQKIPLPEALYGEFKAAVIDVIEDRLTFLEAAIEEMVK
jgi:hypothetical protein